MESGSVSDCQMDEKAFEILRAVKVNSVKLALNETWTLRKPDFSGHILQSRRSNLDIPIRNATSLRRRGKNSAACSTVTGWPYYIPFFCDMKPCSWNARSASTKELKGGWTRINRNVTPCYIAEVCNRLLRDCIS